MHRKTTDAYFSSQVTTASPARLRLMLIEGAIRSARESQQLWDEPDIDALTAALDRCEAILTELLASVRPTASDVAKNVGRIYLYLYGAMAKARLHHDPAPLSDILRILEIERDTWRAVCMNSAETVPPPSTPHGKRLSLEA